MEKKPFVLILIFLLVTISAAWISTHREPLNQLIIHGSLPDKELKKIESIVWSEMGRIYFREGIPKAGIKRTASLCYAYLGLRISEISVSDSGLVTVRVPLKSTNGVPFSFNFVLTNGVEGWKFVQ